MKLRRSSVLQRVVWSVLLGSSIACNEPTAPSQSPTDFEIVYVGALDNGVGFVSMSEDGSNQRVLARPSDFPFDPRLSPDGNFILYYGGATKQVFVTDLRTGRETQLTAGTDWNVGPTWSPDGSRIAFLRGADTSLAAFAVYTMRADGSDVQQLTPNEFAVGAVAWSPDGRLLALQRGDYKLVLVDAATGSLAQVLTPTSFGYSPDFSPDGTQIAYTSQEEIFVANVDGSDAHRLTMITPKVPFNQGPRWSPDGRSLTYWSDYVTGTNEGIQNVLYRISRDGFPIDWKGGQIIEGRQPFWRDAP